MKEFVDHISSLKPATIRDYVNTVPTEYSVQPMIPLTRQAQAIGGPARVW